MLAQVAQLVTQSWSVTILLHLTPPRSWDVLGWISNKRFHRWTFPSQTGFTSSEHLPKVDTRCSIQEEKRAKAIFHLLLRHLWQKFSSTRGFRRCACSQTRTFWIPAEVDRCRYRKQQQSKAGLLRFRRNGVLRRTFRTYANVQG